MEDDGQWMLLWNTAQMMEPHKAVSLKKDFVHMFETMNKKKLVKKIFLKVMSCYKTKEP